MTVAEDLRTRWLRGGRQTPNLTGLPIPPAHIGPAQPVTTGQVRIARLRHAYDIWDGPPVNAFVAGGYFRSPGEDLPQGWPEGPIGGFGRQFWQNFITPEDGEDGEWTDLPNILEWDIQHDFQNNGIMVLKVTIENIGYPEIAGPGGAYHAIKRGYYAPNRGYAAPGRGGLLEPTGNPAAPLVPVARNEWFRKLNSGSCQIKLFAGYGDATVPVFTGLIDDDELESHPDRIVLTLRDFGQSLTDMRLFGWNKEPRIKDPVVFYDRLRADNVTAVGHDPAASSSSADHPPSLALDEDSETFWQSDGHAGPDFTEWIEITVPEGRYENVFVFPHYTAMDLWLSVYATEGSSFEGEDLPVGWVDQDKGDVPGGNGGIPFVRHREGMPADGFYLGLGGIFRLGGGSRFRIHFRSLRKDGDRYHAGVNRFFANHRTLTGTDALEGHWVLVEDVADMVKVVLRWAGFKEWDVQSTGVRLKTKQVFPRSNFYIDVIKKAMELTGYVFFMRAPTSESESIGVPVFRRPIVADPDAEPRLTIQDRHLLTGIRIQESDEPRAYIIRVRGRTARKEVGGVPLSGDPVRRLMFTFKPPGWKRLGGIVKHYVYTNHSFKTLEQCKFAAYFIALQGLLEAFKGTCSFPAFPAGEDEDRAGRPRFGPELDSHVAVLDVGTGITTRLWLSNVTTEFRKAESGTRFWQNVGGTLVDVPEVRRMVEIINDASRSSE